MSTELTRSTNALLNSPKVQEKFQELLGSKSKAFLTSVLQIVAQNEMLKNADPMSVYMAAATAATLDLPVSNNLGFAWIVPYKSKKYTENGQQEQTVAQFQIGAKGFVQLAIRSGQFKTISETPVYEGQLKSSDPLTGFEFDWNGKTSDKVIGYAAFFSLLSGFEKTLYMTKEQVEAHAKRFSKSYASGPWKSDFDAMARKTVLKALLSKYAPLSIDLQTAMESDQATVTEDAYSYVDNDEDKRASIMERLEIKPEGNTAGGGAAADADTLEPPFTDADVEDDDDLI